MNKAEMIEAIRQRQGTTKNEAERQYDCFLNILIEAFLRHEAVSLVGFGKFTVSQRSARSFTLPDGTAEVTVADRHYLKFQPSTKWKARINP